MPKRSSVSKKIILVVLLVILFFGSLATIGVYILVGNLLLSERQNNLLASTTHSAAEINQKFIISQDISSAIAKRNITIAYIQNSSQRPAKKVELLEFLESMNLGDRYSAIYILDAKGTALVSTDPTFENNNYSFRDYYKEAILGKNYIEVLKGTTSGKIGFYFSSPIYSKENKIIGVAVVKMKPEVIDATTSTEVAANEFDYFFVDKNMVVISTSDEEKVFKSLGGDDLKNISKEELNKRYGLVPDSLTYDLISQKIQSYKEPFYMTIYDEEDGEEELLTVSKLKEKDFYLIFESESEELRNAVLKSTFFIAGGVFLAATTVIFLINLVISGLLKPLQQIKIAANKIALGDFKTRLEVTTNDEIGSLAGDIDKMAENISNVNEKQSETIKEKTAELSSKLEQLERMNKIMVGRELKMVELKAKLEAKEEQTKE